MHTMNKVSIILFVLSCLLTIHCRNQDKTDKLAEYLRNEKRLREKIEDAKALEDSLAERRRKSSIHWEAELLRLRKNPQEWPVLLRKLKSG